jgi:putative ABC transport system ATP-binding protein
LFADEPTGNLDSVTSGSILAALEELNRVKGLTVILVTHDEAVSSRCSRVLSLADGCLLGQEEE